MGSFLSIPVLVIATILQATLMPQIAVLGGRPDLVFLTVILWSINAPLETGVVWAMVGGVMLDLLSAAPTGTSIVGMILIVFAVNALKDQIYSLNLMLVMGIIGVGTIFQQIIIMIILSLTGFTVLFIESLGYVVLPTMVYNLVFALPVYWFVRRMQRRFTEPRRRVLGRNFY